MTMSTYDYMKSEAINATEATAVKKLNINRKPKARMFSKEG